MGYLHLDLSFFSEPEFVKPHVFSEPEALLFLIRSQAFQDREEWPNNVSYKLLAGQCFINLRETANKFQWSVGKLQRYINRLTDRGVLVSSVVQGCTQLSFVNSRYYVLGRNKVETPIDTGLDTGLDTGSGTNKNNNKQQQTTIISTGESSPRKKTKSNTLSTFKRDPNEIRVPEGDESINIYMLPEKWEYLKKMLGRACAYHLCEDVYSFHKNKRGFWKADHYELITKRNTFLLQQGKRFAEKLTDTDGTRLPDGFYPSWKVDRLKGAA